MVYKMRWHKHWTTAEREPRPPPPPPNSGPQLTTPPAPMCQPEDQCPVKRKVALSNAVVHILVVAQRPLSVDGRTLPLVIPTYLPRFQVDTVFHRHWSYYQLRHKVVLPRDIKRLTANSINKLRRGQRRCRCVRHVSDPLHFDFHACPVWHRAWITLIMTSNDTVDQHRFDRRTQSCTARRTSHFAWPQPAWAGKCPSSVKPICRPAARSTPIY